MSTRYEEAANAAATAALAAANAASCAAIAAAYISNSVICISNTIYGSFDQSPCASAVASYIAGASRAAAEATAAAANARLAAEVAAIAKPTPICDVDNDSGYDSPPATCWTVDDAFFHAHASAAKDRQTATPVPQSTPPKSQQPGANVLRGGLLIKHNKYRHVMTAYGTVTETLRFKKLITVRGTDIWPENKFSLLPEKYLRSLAVRSYSRTPREGEMAWGLLEVDEPGTQMRYGFGRVVSVAENVNVWLVTNGTEDLGVNVY